MPLYEYRCNSCRKRTTTLVRGFSETPDPVCEHCGAKDLTRLMSMFAIQKPGTDDSMPDSAFDNVDESNPREMADWMRRMQGQMGGTSEEFEEIAQDYERGAAHDDGAPSSAGGSAE